MIIRAQIALRPVNAEAWRLFRFAAATLGEDGARAYGPRWAPVGADARGLVSSRSVTSMSADPFDLTRFVAAQAGVFAQALEELRAGRKRTHWMWFVFPQLKGLGRSPTALFYGVSSLDEASAYLQHPVLGPRLEQAVAAVEASGAPSLHALFGAPDDLKFGSSMTLFSIAAPDGPFQAALDRWCGGPDLRTVALLERG